MVKIIETIWTVCVARPFDVALVERKWSQRKIYCTQNPEEILWKTRSIKNLDVE